MVTSILTLISPLMKGLSMTASGRVGTMRRVSGLVRPDIGIDKLTEVSGMLEICHRVK